MNFRNRKLVTTVRVLLGLFMLMSGVTGFMGAPDMATIPAPMQPYTLQLWDMGIFQMIKSTELVIGLMLVAGFFPAIAVVMLVPLCVGVLVFNGTVAPAYLPTGLLVSALTTYLAYAYWDKYASLLKR